MFPFSPETLLQLTHERLAERAESARRWRLASDARAGASPARPPVEARLTGSGAPERPARPERPVPDDDVEAVVDSAALTATPPR